MLAAAWLTGACSATQPYSCSTKGSHDADRLAKILSTDFHSVYEPNVLDDCDSGGQRYVTFRIRSVDSALTDFNNHSGCTPGDADRDGPVFRCHLNDVVAEFLIVSPKAGSSQGVVQPLT
jgi:hypothetical protein